LVGIAPVLTPLAVIGDVVVLAGAIVLHGRRHEYPTIAVAVAAGAVIGGQIRAVCLLIPERVSRYRTAG
jgi:hypothetical protein